MVVTDLSFVDAANDRPPRQPGDDAAPPGERIEVHPMPTRPVVLLAVAEEGGGVCNVRVFESELVDAVVGEGVDVFPDGGDGVDVSAAHDAGGPDFERLGGVEERVERGRAVTHECGAVGVVMVVSRVAEVRQPGIGEACRQVACEVRAVGETGDFIKKPPTALDQVKHIVRPQQRFTPAG